MPLTIDTADVQNEPVNIYDADLSAKKAAGWRLPTRAELDEMLARHRSGRGRFRNGAYMSSEGGIPWSNWILDFSTGAWREADTTESHWGCAYIRMVRDEE